MHTIVSRSGATVSFQRSGRGPLLVLIHGGFSDHKTNWEFVLPAFEKHFTVVTVARRGRGETDATVGHTLEDEAADAVSIIESLGEPVFLLGHSYGAQVALRAATPALVRKLVLYEAPSPATLRTELLAELMRISKSGDWDQFAWLFFHRGLSVPAEELDRLRAEGLWEPIVADAQATLGDLRALAGSRFEPERYRTLDIPTLLQVGSESPRGLWVTDELVAVLPDVRVDALLGQAHEGMTTAPGLYAESVIRFLIGGTHGVRDLPL